tara:strand:+ start:167 stop:523 length:357 start_codon:yes stop_codon:yes gene_type:complete
MQGRLGFRIRDLVREICDTHNIQILKGHISTDHIHLFISIPPQISVSRIVQLLKGKTARKVLQEFPKLKPRFWGKHFWSRGYFVATSGTITDEMIVQYLENQDDDQDKRGDQFTVLDV